jgi:hypothetical protein
MAYLICSSCGRQLTRSSSVGSLSDYDGDAQDRAPAVPAGMLVQIGPEDVAPSPADSVVLDELRRSPGSIAGNPEDIICGNVKPCGDRSGCCGPSGSGGPNLSCICGAVLATEWGDCWTRAEVRFLPGSAVLIARAFGSGAGCSSALSASHGRRSDGPVADRVKCSAYRRAKRSGSQLGATRL